MDWIVNTINLSGWVFLLAHVGVSLFLDRETFLSSDISLAVYVLQGIQLFQISDIILILIGKSKGSLLGAFMQIFARNLVSLLFISAESDKLRFATVAIIWAMADVNRYLYYLFKKNAITGFLRYNSFIILYPIGVYGEMLIINDYIKRNALTLSDNEINLIRLVQVLIIGGMFYLYSYMLSSRKKYNKSLQVESEKPSEKGGETIPESPKKPSKRD